MQNIVKNNVTITFSTDFIRLVLWIDWCIVGFLTKMYNSARINGQLKLSVSNSLLHCAQLRLQVISKASVWDPFFFFSLEVMLSGLSNTVICFQLTSISLTYATNIRKNRSVRKCHSQSAECSRLRMKDINQPQRSDLTYIAEGFSGELININSFHPRIAIRDSSDVFKKFDLLAIVAWGRDKTKLLGLNKVINVPEFLSSPFPLRDSINRAIQLFRWTWYSCFNYLIAAHAGAPP